LKAFSAANFEGQWKTLGKLATIGEFREGSVSTPIKEGDGPVSHACEARFNFHAAVASSTSTSGVLHAGHAAACSGTALPQLEQWTDEDEDKDKDKERRQGRRRPPQN
jgi:hypothetical protein